MPTRFLSLRLVLAMQRDLVDSFGGAQGLRDEAALESALGQPEATFRGRPLHPGVAEQAAAYLFHLCMAHAFVDGNKRIALAATDTFLRFNGYRLTWPDDRAYETVMAVARGEVGKDELAGLLRTAVAQIRE